MERNYKIAKLEIKNSNNQNRESKLDDCYFVLKYFECGFNLISALHFESYLFLFFFFCRYLLFDYFEDLKGKPLSNQTDIISWCWSVFFMA